MSIWDEAELIEEKKEQQPPKSIWDEAELLEVSGTSGRQAQTKPTPIRPVQKQETQALNNLTTKNNNENITLTGGVEQRLYNKSKNPVRNFFRQAGRNTARFLLPKKIENKFLGSKEDEEFLNRYNNNNVPSYAEIKYSLDNNEISRERAEELINRRYKLDILQADSEYRDVRNRNIGQGIVDIGSAAIPVGAGATVTSLGAKALRPLMGKKIGGMVTRGAAGGAIGGGIHGLETGFVNEDVNPLIQGAIEAGAGLGLGGLGAYGLGKIAQRLDARALKNHKPISQMTSAENEVIKNEGKRYKMTKDIGFDQQAGTPPAAAQSLTTDIINDVQDNFNHNINHREVKPARLKDTMKKAGVLPEQLENKNIEYEVLHNPDTVAKAQEAIWADANAVHRDLLKKISSQGDYENYVLSADDVVKARELATKLYKEGNTEEAVELTEGIIKAASKTGQALQAYTLWARTTPEGAVTYARKMIERYNKSQHKNIKLTDAQAKEIEELAQKVQQTSEGTRENEVAIGKMQKYIADLMPASWTKKYDTYRYINMLLSSKSRVKDFFLTGLNSVDSALDELIANGIDRVRTLFPNQPKAFDGLKTAEWLNGLKKGFNEGIEDVALNINTSRSGETGRYGLPKTRSFNYTPLREIERTPRGLLQLGENALSLGEKGLAYTLQVPDRMFYEARYASSLADQMAAAGTNKPTQAMINQASKEALEAVYQDDSWVSRIGNSTRDLINKVPENLENNLKLPENSVPRIGNFIAPFVTTPANIVNIGLKNSIGAMIGMPKLLRAATPQEIRDAEMLVARNLKGLLPMGLGVGIGLGNIKSNIGQNDYQNDAVTGLKPQSIVIGNKTVSLKDYPQWSIPASIGTGLVQGGIPQAAVNALEAVGDISALKAVGDALDAFKPRYGQNPTPAEIANNLFRSQGVNILSQNIPFGGALGELRNNIDPYAREMYMPVGNTTPEMVSNSLKYAGNRIQNRIPIASTLLPHKYNAIGEHVRINNINNPAVRAASEAIDFGIRNYNENPVYNKLAAFQEEMKDTDYTGKSKIGLHTPSRTVYVNGESIKLNNEQYSNFSHDYTKINYILKGMAVNNEEYQNMSDEEKVEYLSDLRKSAEEAVKIMQFDHTPSKKFHKYTQYILDNYLQLITD